MVVADQSARPVKAGKTCDDANAALRGVVEDHQVLAVGGLGLCGILEALISALRDSSAMDLTA